MLCFGAIWGRECVLTFKERGEEEKLRSEYSEYKTTRLFRTYFEVKKGRLIFGPIRYYAKNSWNKLPVDLRLAPTLTAFKTRLKTYMFALDFC